MSKGPAAFKKTDIRRAVEAARAAGLQVAGVEVRRDGSIFVRYGEPLAKDESRPDDALTALIAGIVDNGKAQAAR